MTISQTIEYLRAYNAWRRGNDEPQPDPKEVGMAIDTACELLATLKGLGASTCSPCPFCGERDKLVVDCTSLVTSQLGIDHQSGNVDCEACGAAGPYIHAKGEETDRLTDMIWEAWNHRENDEMMDRHFKQTPPEKGNDQ